MSTGSDGASKRASSPGHGEESTGDGDAAESSVASRRKLFRDRLPGALLGPLDALFPTSKRPSPVYGARQPAFLRAASARAAKRARSNLVRAVLGLTGVLILLLNPATLNAIGRTSFFGMIIATMLPPTFALPTLMMLVGLLCLGMCVGWAWGCAAMAAAASARGVHTALPSGTNLPEILQADIFHGDYLDWRSSVVFGCFLGFGLFWLAVVSAKRPKLFVSTLFASIVTDVMCLYGSLFPAPEYRLAELILVPTACFVLIALVITLLVFPESLNYRWTIDLVDKFLSPVLQRSHLHSKLLTTPPPGAGDEWRVFADAVTTTQASMSTGLSGLLALLSRMDVEVSIGWLSAGDLKGLTRALKELHARAIGLAVLYTTVETRQKRPLTTDAAATKRGAHDLPSLLPLLATASGELRAATDTALESVMGWLVAQNDARWGALSRWASRKHSLPAAFDLGVVAQELERELVAYRREKRSGILAPFEPFFDKQTGALLPPERRQGTFAPGSLLTVLAASDNLVTYVEAVLALVREVAALQQQRTRSRLWLPTTFHSVGKLLQGGKRTTAAFDEHDDPDQIETIAEVGTDDERAAAPGITAEMGERLQNKRERASAPLKPAPRSADALPPKNAWQRCTLAISRVLHFFISPEAIFAFKYVGASIVIWLPQVFPASAWFCYSHKSIWALITAQGVMAVYAGAQVMSSINKLLGIAAGLVYGMLIWYVGSAGGHGTPYGVGAATVVLMTPVLAVRIFATPASTQVALQLAVTTILVIGYSWQDEHLHTLGNPGTGYNIAWRRALLVIIGVGVATVFMLVPPQSTRRLVRRTHATCIRELARLYTVVLAAWLREEHLSATEAFAPAEQKRARERMLALRLKLNANRVALGQASYELSLRGDFPLEAHTRLVTTQFVLLQALAQLGQALVRLDPRWRTQLVQHTAFLNRPLIADVSSLLALISLALRENTPLPTATPGPLVDRLLYHERRLPAHQVDDDRLIEVEGARVGDFKLTRAVLEDERFGVYASALQALATILLAVDELERTTKELVGHDDDFPGYDELVSSGR